VTRLAGFIAVLGGLVVLAIGAMVSTSVLLRWLAGQPIPGDFEFVQMGTAIAVFAFLPFCQARRGNIIVDSFTARLPGRVRRVIDGAWDLVYAGAIGVIAWCMIAGVRENMANGTSTMVLQLPLWPAFAIATALMAFLAVVAAWSGITLLRRRRDPPPPPRQAPPA